MFTPDTIGAYYYYIDGSLPGQLIGDSTVDYFSSGTYNLGLQYFNGVGLSSCLNSPGYSPAAFIIDEYDLSIVDVLTADEICGVSSATLTIDIDSSNITNNSFISFFINDDSVIASINQSETFYIPHSVIYDSIYIQDAQGCKVYWDFPLMAEQIINTSIDETIIKESCIGYDGEINILVDNGQGFYNYTLSKQIPFNIPMIIDSDVTSTYDSKNVMRFLKNTFIEIRDDSGCVKLDTFVVEQVVPFTYYP